MKINKVKIENFLSIGNAEIDFEDFSELVLVEGKNLDTNPTSSNGAGKSSVIEALCFALFGKTIRKTTEKSIINKYTKGKCRVTLTVNDNVVIERTKKPPRLVVKVDDENVTKDGIASTQKYLEKVLNINQSVFMASIVFGQGIKTNFLTSTPDEKRSIIQNFLNISDLLSTRSKIRSLKSASLNEKKVQTTLLDESLSRIDKMSAKIKELRTTKKQINNLFSADKIKFIENHSLSEIQERERTYHELDLVYEQTAQTRSRLRSDIEDARMRIKNYKGGACEHCSKVSYRIWELMNKDEEFTKNALVSLDEYKKDMSRLREQLDECEVPITVQDFETIEFFKNIDSELKILRDQKKDQQKIKRKHMKDMSFHQKRHDLLKFWDVAFSEQGLVRYVIRNILSFFNERANYYMKFLTAGNFSIEFDETLKEEVYLKDSLVYYESLSGGEKKKVSLSVMLALNDLLLLSGKSRANIVFFDEIADSLDDEGIKGIYELIKEVSEVKKMFIISHNDYLIGMIEDWADLLKVQKKKNITTIKKKSNAHI